MTSKNEIEKKIHQFARLDTVGAAVAFLSTLGYDSSRANIPIKDLLGNTEISSKEIKSASVFMQLVNATMSGSETLFGIGQIDDRNIESYLFVAVDLVKHEYNRSTLAEITRQINKRFSIPVFVIFRYGNYITLSIIYRRIHKKDKQKDVLEKVTLIKDINVKEPHRGHIDILYDLALPQLRTKYPVTNFIELDNTWRKVLDTKELNKRFYKEIANWFHWAKTEARFPGGIDEVNLLRLLTRVIFIWFIKEKRLVPDHLFEEKTITPYLKGNNHYYNAILQNLFFGTLNCVIGERKFRDTKTFQGKSTSYGVKTQYRYADFFQCSAKEAEKLFATIPFLNGGLFDCLDTANDTGKVEYIDGFSDTPKQQATLPDELFFSVKKQIDLSSVFGAKSKKVDVYGLFHTLNRYKFTVAENTPLEEDVALDPELLGNVFENLLAAYNPETRETARKSTGSFYTPREIVDYMVEQSLTHYPESDWLNLKMLDPACGSGAFPMGVLNAMVNRLASDQSHKERYELKKHIIENCLFGVDIQPIAIQITKLRFFISLVCEQEKDDTQDNFGITALPNLETKFVAANTLIGITRPEQKDLSYSKVIKLETELKKIRHDYFSANTRSKKLELQKKDEDKRKELSAALKELGWKTDVAEKIAAWNPYDQNTAAEWFDPEWMFGIKDGFDVVIGNPPYVSHDKIPNSFDLKTEYNDIWTPFSDMYCYFFGQGMRVLKTSGILAFITSNSYIKAEYGASLRNLLGKNSIYALINIETSQVFLSAIVNTAVAIVAKKHADSKAKTIVTNSSLSTESFSDYIERKAFLLPASRFAQCSWVLEKEEVLCILDKMKACGSSLETLGAKIRLGIATGDNKAFILTKEQYQEFIDRDAKNLEVMKPILRGRNIERFYFETPTEYLILSKNGVNLPADYPDLAEHLGNFGDKFKMRGAKGKFWWNLRACDFYEDFKKEKIIWIELADKGRFAICREEIYLINSAYFMLPPPDFESEFFLGILNSRLVEFFVKKYAETSGMGTTRWINSIVSNIPIPAVLSKQQPIIALVNKIRSAKKKNPQADTAVLEHEIDALVFRLYGLTEEEMLSVLLSQNVSETERRRIQAFYKDHEAKDRNNV